ncbi:hypothetical protein B0H66DRAFT_497837 [Apodospora peruviana]|uniref:NADH:flavin oxidoreductase/NADH oxidase N-terminal domain-containing protein n=1 Tax=Apodospora peruviana TaxID=516989 RepID=A0AAE0I5Q6_9PEZI|nr:hypothetical protein B0H66DRAFT_497837 [Apodospora peruviana]
MSSSTNLFKPLTVGNIQLKHRVAMAPLTRFRADDDHVPTPMMAEYYSQRASVPGTLIVSEATFIAADSGGYPNVPGIYNDAQIAGWRQVTDAVHAKGSYIVCQLWSLGRAASADFAAKEGITIKSASDVPIDANSPTPVPLTIAEIGQRVQDYATAARNAIAAGFDGVEIHGANGYLIDQFLQDVSNLRTDEYGGSVEKRSRFAVEVVKAVVEAVGAERTGIRLSPFSRFQSMRMADPVPQFSDVITKIKGFGLAYLHLVRSVIAGNAREKPDAEDDSLDFAVNLWGDKPLLLAGGLTPELAKEFVDEHYADKNVVAVFGRHFISTPDLVFRVREGIELNKYDRSTFYNAKEARGYTDQPFSEEFERLYGKEAGTLLN